MTNIKANKILESKGNSFITLERITLDERAPAEIRRTAFLANNKKFGKSPSQKVFPEVEGDTPKPAVNINNKQIYNRSK